MFFIFLSVWTEKCALFFIIIVEHERSLLNLRNSSWTKKKLTQGLITGLYLAHVMTTLVFCQYTFINFNFIYFLMYLYSL